MRAQGGALCDWCWQTGGKERRHVGGGGGGHRCREENRLEGWWLEEGGSLKLGVKVASTLELDSRKNLKHTEQGVSKTGNYAKNTDEVKIS